MAGQQNQFVKFIAYLQILGIILVVFGHSFHQYPDGENGTSLLIYRMFYNFRMPLFLFVSGFLMVFTTIGREGHNLNFGKFLTKKVKRLLVPFAVLTLVTFVPRAALSGMADDDIELSLSACMRSLVFTDELPIPFFWFIQASFLLLIFNYGLICLSRRLRVRDAVLFVGLLLLFVVLPLFEWGNTEIFGHTSAIYMGIYFVAGAVYGRYRNPVDRYIKWESPLTFCLFFVFWLTLFLLGEGTYIARIASFFGIGMCICVARFMVAHNVRILDHLTGTNYIIFLLSWYFNVATQQVLSHFVVLPWWVHTILSLTLGIYVPWAIFRLMVRHKQRKGVKVAAFLLGQNINR